MTTNKKIYITATLVAIFIVTVSIIDRFSRRNYLSNVIFGGTPPTSFDVSFESEGEIHWMVVEAPGGSLINFLENDGWSKLEAENFWASAPANGFDKIIRSEKLTSNQLLNYYTKKSGPGQIGNCVIIDQEVGVRDSAIFSVFRY